MDLSRPTGLGTQSPTDHNQLPTYLPIYPPTRPDLPTYPANVGTHPEGMRQVVGGKQPAESRPTMLASHISLWPFHKHLPCLDSMPSPPRHFHCHFTYHFRLINHPQVTGCSSHSAAADSCQAIRSLGVHHKVNVTVESVCEFLVCFGLHCSVVRCGACGRGDEMR